MNFLDQRRALIAALAACLASAPAGAAVVLDQIAEAAVITSHGSLLDPLFTFDADGEEATPTATASSTLPSPAGDSSMGTAQATLDGPLRAFARTGGPVEETLPLGAASGASWTAIYRAETAPGETEVDVDLALHVSGALTLSDSGAALAGLLSADFGATLFVVGEPPPGGGGASTPFGLFDGSADLGIDSLGAYELVRNGDLAAPLFDLSFVLGSGCDGSGACVVDVVADLMLDDALTLADGDEFGVLLVLTSSSVAPGAGAVFSESDFTRTATLAVSSGRGSVTRVLATIVPEPASFLLLVSGLLAFAYARSRSMTSRPRKPTR